MVFEAMDSAQPEVTGLFGGHDEAGAVQFDAGATEALVGFERDSNSRVGSDGEVRVYETVAFGEFNFGCAFVFAGFFSGHAKEAAFASTCLNHGHGDSHR